MIKTFTIDLDNPSDIKKHISYLQKVRKEKLRSLGYVEINFNTTKMNYNT